MSWLDLKQFGWDTYYSDVFREKLSGAIVPPMSKRLNRNNPRLQFTNKWRCKHLSRNWNSALCCWEIGGGRRVIEKIRNSDTFQTSLQILVYFHKSTCDPKILEKVLGTVDHVHILKFNLWSNNILIQIWIHPPELSLIVQERQTLKLGSIER